MTSTHSQSAVVGAVHQPPYRGDIKYFKSHLADLAIDDVVKIASAHERIKSLEEILPGKLKVTLVDVVTNSLRITNLENVPTYMVTDGPRLEAVRKNPNLAPVQGAHRVWKGQVAQAS